MKSYFQKFFFIMNILFTMNVFAYPVEVKPTDPGYTLFASSTVGIIKDNDLRDTCSGVALNGTTLLTAAHCIYNNNTQKLLDALYLITSSGEINITPGMITHYNYGGQLDYLNYANRGYDLATVTFSKPIFKDNLKITPDNYLKILVPWPTLPDELWTTTGQDILAMGWGSHKTLTVGQVISKYQPGAGLNDICILRHAKGSNQEYFQNNLYTFPKSGVKADINGMLCYDAKLGTELGDSGGPIFIYNRQNQSYKLLGVMSGLSIDSDGKKQWAITLLDNPVFLKAFYN